jgi:hypothetical protein
MFYHVDETFVFGVCHSLITDFDPSSAVPPPILGYCYFYLAEFQVGLKGLVRVTTILVREG